jgi:hypothetical protein
MRAACVVTLLTLAVAGALAPLSPSLVERWFSTSIYPAIQQIITPMSNSVPIALFDLLCIAATILVVAVLIRAVRAATRSRSAWPVARAVGYLALGAAAVYLWFLLFWGLNYRRVPMTTRINVDSGGPAATAVMQLGRDAVSELNGLYREAHAVGWREQPMDDLALTRGFNEIQRALSDAPLAVPGRLKQTLFGPYFRWTSVDGMVNPFGLEVLANPDLLPFERPFVAAHEWAHLAGYADEAEASFVGWLACLRGGPAARYSAWLLMYWQVSAELNEAERASLAAALAPGPRADIDAIIARLRRGEWPLLRNAGWQVYDQYLKANRVEEGVRSYGLVVTLILGAQFEDGWLPVRRELSPAPRRGPGRADRPPGS